MSLRRLIFLSSLVLAVAALSPAATLGAAKGTDRPVSGRSTGTVVLDLATGAGISETSGQLSHLGRITSTVDVTSFTLTGPDTFSFTGTATDVAAKGDKLFTTGASTGTPTGTEASAIFTITGGTGRFADASGTGTLRAVLSGSPTWPAGLNDPMRPQRDSEEKRERPPFRPIGRDRSLRNQRIMQRELLTNYERINWPRSGDSGVRTIGT